MSSDFIPQTKEVKVIPKDLETKWGAVQACSTTLALFDQGYFSPRHAQHIPASMAFLAKLHEQTLEDALKHPEAHMIPELKKLIEEGNSDGETKEA